MPKVSVVMPVYNVEKYIDESIESILGQSFSDFEFIIIDDCSSDRTYSRAQAWQNIDSRIVLLRNNVNSGISISLNRAVMHVTGDYIVRMDGDDISVIDRIEKLISFLDSNPDVDLVGSSYIGINEDGEERNRVLMPGDLRIIDRIIMHTSPVSHIWAARKSVYDKIQYRTDTVEDYDFLLRMASLGMKFTNLPDFLYKVRLCDGNTRATRGLKQAKAVRYVRKLYKERMRNKTFNDSYSAADFKKYTSSLPFVLRMHRISDKLINKGVHAKILPIKVLFAFISIFFSFYNLEYLYDRFYIKLQIHFLSKSLK